MIYQLNQINQIKVGASTTDNKVLDVVDAADEPAGARRKKFNRSPSCFLACSDSTSPGTQKMAAIRALSLSSIAALVAAAMFVPVGITLPTLAVAQSGSRLCGWTTEIPAKGVAIGLLYEARTKDTSYKKQCSEVIEKMQKEIEKDATLSAMTWTKVDKATCESVGTKFIDSKDHKSNDMCDYMGAKTPFKVQKSTTADKVATTVYTKLG
jgi:hypothetical protein